jgi:N-acetylglucosaminyldiphosphoundecaprenol N-acetyl-beta-D-mannosaminyltransferase
MSMLIPSCEILGVPVSRITMDSALAAIESWANAGESHYVCACDVHSMMRAQSDPEHLAALRGASMITPDGQPVVWTAHSRGVSDMQRVCGPDLLPQLCRQSLAKGWRHYFYGGADGVAGELAQQLTREYPGLKVAGIDSPPFRTLTAEEQEAALERIRASGTKILWVGLGCPKQEKWMLAHRVKLPGVDFHVARLERAPAWMRHNGLEWLHRLLTEPRRLWRRYLVLAPQFVAASLFETLSQRVARPRPKP